MRERSASSSTNDISGEGAGVCAFIGAANLHLRTSSSAALQSAIGVEKHYALSMSDVENTQREWLAQILRETGVSPTNLARRAGLSPSTLTRFMNSDIDGHVLSARTIAKIQHAAEAGETSAAAPPGGFAESDGDLLAGDPHPMRTAIDALADRFNARDAWVLRSRSLEAAGYRVGDILIVDLAEMAEAGDLVCAQVYSWRERSARTVFRIYEPPYLLAATTIDLGARRPLVVDDDQVVIKGVVVASVRDPRSAKPRIVAE